MYIRQEFHDWSRRSPQPPNLDLVLLLGEDEVSLVVTKSACGGVPMEQHTFSVGYFFAVAIPSIGCGLCCDRSSSGNGNFLVRMVQNVVIQSRFCLQHSN